MEEERRQILLLSGLLLSLPWSQNPHDEEQRKRRDLLLFLSSADIGLFSTCLLFAVTLVCLGPVISGWTLRQSLLSSVLNLGRVQNEGRNAPAPTAGSLFPALSVGLIYSQLKLHLMDCGVR